MAQLDAIALSKTVKQRLVDFALDAHFVQDTNLNAICRSIWAGSPETGGLLSDLWIEGAFPAKTVEESLSTLVQQKLFNAELCSHLDKPKVVPQNRPLYTHQKDAILKAQEAHSNSEKPALVITAGTGAGKTESFLLPLLNDLFKNPGNAGQGVKCIILYPMNALVNDQVDRLYEWLQGQHRVTLFHFTGETPEDNASANRDGVKPWDVCRMRTRQEARGLETHNGQRIDITSSERGPVPDIIITNYSMLEYMLCRPQDAVFFGKSLRTIVLDEAHLYTGTLAAEITLLLRRLLERCEVKSEHVLHIATSATIGRDEPGELEVFAAKLFTKKQSLVQVVQGHSMRVSFPKSVQPKVLPSFSDIISQSWLEAATIELDMQSEPQLATNVEACVKLLTSLSVVVDKSIVTQAMGSSNNKPAQLLYDALNYSPLIHTIEDILWERKRLSLHDLSMRLWGVAHESATYATAILLQLGAAARKSVDAYPLLPNRIHMLARPTDGLVVCLNSDCTGPDEHKLADIGCVSEGMRDHCPFCNYATLSLYSCNHCGTWVLAGSYDKEHDYLKPTFAESSSKENTRLICLVPHSHPDSEQISFDKETGACNGSGKEKRFLYAIKNCLHCGEEAESWRPFAQSAPLTLSILLKFRLTDRKKGSLTVQKLPDGVRLVCFFQTNENKGPLRHELYHIDAIASGRLCEFCSRWRCHDEPVRCAAV